MLSLLWWRRYWVYRGVAVYSALLGTYLVAFKPVNAVPFGIVCWGAAWFIWRVGRKVAETKEPTFYL